MQKWEYLLKDWYRGRTGGLNDKASPWQSNFDFTQLGLEGWELVGVVPSSDEPGDYASGFTTTVKFIFKRPKA